MVSRRPPTDAQRLDRHEADLLSHAKTLSVFTEELQDTKHVLAEMAIERAVRVEVDRNLNERLARIEKSIDNLTVSIDKKFAPWTGGLKWTVITVSGVVVVALMKFIISGGLIVSP